jgi:hypothetical protein
VLNKISSNAHHLFRPNAPKLWVAQISWHDNFTPTGSEGDGRILLTPGARNFKLRPSR